MIRLTVDGHPVSVPEGATVLAAVRKAGGDLPTLCHHDGLPPDGSCRLCAVHVDWDAHPRPACDTVCTDGMEVTTGGRVLETARREVVRLLLADHPTPCRDPHDPRGPCELEALAEQLGVAVPEGPAKAKVDTAHPAIHTNLSACIQCGRCERACADIQGHRVIGWLGIGPTRRLSFSGKELLQDSLCVACGECVAECPTGALSPASRPLPDMTATETVCPYCGVGCRLTCHTADDRVVQVTSPRESPAGQGRLCVKGRFGLDFVRDAGRLTTPLIRKKGATKPCGPDGFREATWDEALALTANRLTRTVKAHGGTAVAGLGSAKCTNEDNYLFEKWLRAGLASNNVDHCARLCHAPSVVALAGMLGSGAATNPNTDFLRADAIFLIGTNTVETHPVIATFIRQANAAGTRLLVADPRRVGLASEADIHLQQRPGTDLWLVHGIAREVLDAGGADEAYIAAQTERFDAYRDGLLSLDMDEVEQVTGVPRENIREAARIFTQAERVLTGWGMGLTQHVAGSLNCAAVAGLHLMTGQLGRPGAGLNPLRGQSNVQGASDMGVLPNVLPGYQPVAEKPVREKFGQAWGRNLPGAPGLTVVEMFRAARDGQIRAMHIMGENPAVSDPDLAHVHEGLQALSFLAVQDVFFTETAAYADVILPAASVLEREGSVTNTERRIQRTVPVLPPSGESRPDGDILADLMTLAGMDNVTADPAQVLDEMAALTPTHAGVTAARTAGEGVIWPCPEPGHPGTPILHTEGAVKGIATFLPPKLVPPAEAADENFPYLLTTGRSLYHYQTGTLSRKARLLDELVHDAWVEIHPETLGEAGLKDGDLVCVTSRRGVIRVRARATEGALPGVLFVPFHFAESPVNRLVHDQLDPQAKIPEYKCVAVRLESSS